MVVGFSGKEIDPAEEAGHGFVCGTLVKRFWSVHLAQAAFKHQGDALRHDHGFPLVVGDDDDSDAGAFLKPQD